MKVRSLGWGDPLEKGVAAHASFLTWRSHGQRGLAGYSLWGRRESDRTGETARTRLLVDKGFSLGWHLLIFKWLNLVHHKLWRDVKRNDKSLILRRFPALSTKHRKETLVPRTHISALVLVCPHPRILGTCSGSRCHLSPVWGHPNPCRGHSMLEPLALLCHYKQWLWTFRYRRIWPVWSRQRFPAPVVSDFVC